MCSPRARHLPNLRPLVIPEKLSYYHSSPLDSSSSPAAFSSPAESDIVPTPLFRQQDGYARLSPENGGYVSLFRYEPDGEEGVHIQDPQDFSAFPTSSTPPIEVSYPCASRSFGDARNAPSGMSMMAGIQDSYQAFEIDPCPNEMGTEDAYHGPEIPSFSMTQDDSRDMDNSVELNACLYSPNFPDGHQLNRSFAHLYLLEDELGSGGYGFVMTARHRKKGFEVAVKFIIKDKVPNHAWIEDESIGKLPTEVMLLSCLDHKNIVKCLDIFEDLVYFYLVQELHGSPWNKAQRDHPMAMAASSLLRAPTPSLSPSSSLSSVASSESSASQNLSLHVKYPSGSPKLYRSKSCMARDLTPRPPLALRPRFSRRASHDLFECIEQSEHKCLPEPQARHVFAQVVDAVHYLHMQGITHRDIKDENLVIDKDLNVKLIDFGSAIIEDSNKPRLYYTLFYGTTAYAASEILLKQEYQAAPAEVWTLGVLLSYLLTGSSPFPTIKDTVEGRICISEGGRFSGGALSLMQRCLDPNPSTRATISEVKNHPWLSNN